MVSHQASEIARLERKLADLEKLRSIRQGGRTAGTAKVTTLTDPDNPSRVTGRQVTYEDGRQEAVVRPETISYQIRMSRGEVEST